MYVLITVNVSLQTNASVLIHKNTLEKTVSTPYAMDLEQILLMYAMETVHVSLLTIVDVI